MADDNHENGTSNGDVPEIELIIKVSVPRAVVSEIERPGGPRGFKGAGRRGRGRRRKKGGNRPVRAMGVDGAVYFIPWLIRRRSPAGNLQLSSLLFPSGILLAATVKIDRFADGDR